MTNNVRAAADYIDELSRELAVIAETHGLHTTAYVLEIASLSVSEKDNRRQANKAPRQTRKTS